MSFRRTSAGLSSLHLFYNVDVIVFVEGGVPISRARVDDGEGNDVSVDILFWRKIFEHFRPDIRAKFRAVGGKPTVESIAKDIQSGAISKAVAAMDADYDDFCSEQIGHPNVLYTHGYSWENDVCVVPVFEEAFYSFVPVDRVANPIRHLVQPQMDEFFDGIVRYVRADFMLCVLGSSLFDREKPLGTLVLDDGVPTLNKGWLRNRFRGRRPPNVKVSLLHDVKGLSSGRHLVGHVLMEFFYRVFCVLVRGFPGRNRIPKDFFEALMIANLIETFRRGYLPAFNVEYQSRMAGINV